MVIYLVEVFDHADFGNVKERRWDYSRIMANNWGLEQINALNAKDEFKGWYYRLFEIEQIAIDNSAAKW